MPEIFQKLTTLLAGQEAKAVEAMPDLSSPSTKRETATDTDDRGANASEDEVRHLTPKWTLTAFSECNQSTADGNLLINKT